MDERAVARAYPDRERGAILCELEPDESVQEQAPERSADQSEVDRSKPLHEEGDVSSCPGCDGAWRRWTYCVNWRAGGDDARVEEDCDELLSSVEVEECCDLSPAHCCVL